MWLQSTVWLRLQGYSLWLQVDLKGTYSKVYKSTITITYKLQYYDHTIGLLRMNGKYCPFLHKRFCCIAILRPTSYTQGCF